MPLQLALIAPGWFMDILNHTKALPEGKPEELLSYSELSKQFPLLGTYQRNHVGIFVDSLRSLELSHSTCLVQAHLVWYAFYFTSVTMGTGFDAAGFVTAASTGQSHFFPREDNNGTNHSNLERTSTEKLDRITLTH